jgi:hypothetical protein
MSQADAPPSLFSERRKGQGLGFGPGVLFFEPPQAKAMPVCHEGSIKETSTMLYLYKAVKEQIPVSRFSKRDLLTGFPF